MLLICHPRAGGGLKISASAGMTKIYYENLMNEFLKIFKERGFFHQCTDEAGLAKLGNITAYIGFDCTAPTLHVGNMLQIMVLRWLKKTGNTPIILLGGGTTKIGDPSGKDEARKMLNAEDIERNKAGIRKVFDKFGLGDAQFVDNDEWLSGIKYLDFLRDVGRHFSINRMLSFDSVKLRLDREQNLTFLEFNYMILQAYDFVELNKRYGCRLQIGGSDQWGNIVNGVELHRKLNTDHQPSTNNQQPVFGLTAPLITTSSGAKMGKSAAGAIWLDETMLSPYDYYQFWRNTEDADVVKFLKLFTDLPLEEIGKMKEWEGSAKINEAKKILAYEATKLCHGEEEAKKAQDAAITAFEQGGTAGLPEITLEARKYTLAEALVAAALTTSKGEARRLIQGGGARVDDKQITDDKTEIEPRNGMKLSSGKKKHVVVKLAATP